MKTKLCRNMTIGILLILTVATFGMGCGTTSELKPANRTAKLDFSSFTKVAVRDFEHKFSEKVSADPHADIQTVGRRFADMIAIEVRGKGGFQEVSRSNGVDALTLVIAGKVTRYEAGNPAARFWIGMGVGNSYFDATVEFRNGANDAVLGTIAVNKNSWALGGGIAATQTPESFMLGAAKKVGEEVYKAKTGNLPGDSPHSPKNSTRSSGGRLNHGQRDFH